MERRDLLSVIGASAVGLAFVSTHRAVAQGTPLKGAAVGDLIMGKRVKVFLRGGKNFLGTVKAVAGSQIYLTDAKPNPADPATDVLIDTSSGGFDYLQVVPKDDK